MGKRPAKGALEKIRGLNKFAIDYCMLTSLGGHAIPLTSAMTDYLKGEGLVDEDAEEDDIGGFLSRQISAQNGYLFYSLLRSESEKYKPKKKKVNAKEKKVVKKKSSKKKAVKEKAVKKKPAKKKTAKKSKATKSSKNK